MTSLRTEALASVLPWEVGADVPWRVFTSPAAKWAEQPTFVIGEYLFIAFAALALWHALRSGRAHVLAWIAALVAGTANDVIFMALPMVDNFWQAQATIMLTPRLPLYIPCVYVSFMYWPTAAVWRLRLRPLPRAALTGLAAIALYGVYDIIGAKFLWWTWHDTDPPISNRLLGVPVGSTMWVIVFSATFAFLLGRQVDRDPSVRGRTFAKALAIIALLTTAVMVLQLTVLQQLDGGVPGVIGLAIVVAGYGVLAVRGLRSAAPEPPRVQDRVVAAAFGVYFAVMVGLMLFGDPVSHHSPSLHQRVGECYVEETDITGMTRFANLCVSDYDEDFDFSCLEAPPVDGSLWYTVCGRAHARPALYKGAVGVLGALGAALFGGLWLSGRRGRRGG
jgi:hypothetical protein